MVSTFDRIIVAVPHLDTAVDQYGRLLGVEPFIGTSPRGEPVAWLGLPNTVIELEQGRVDSACIRGVIFAAASAGPTDGPIENSLQLDLYQCDGRQTAKFRAQQAPSQSGELKVDHLVLRTTDAQACVELFANDLGVRLALDQTVPAWGGRMLFFRAGKLTLEVIESDRDRDSGNCFWGLAYQCRDIEHAVARLRGEGVELSGIRDGRKPGTRVASVKSHCLEIPTLLIEPAT